jgi:hypothetical protein
MSSHSKVDSSQPRYYVPEYDGWQSQNDELARYKHGHQSRRLG